MLGRSRNRFYHRGVQSTVFGNVLDLQFTEFGKLSDTITHSRAGNATMVDSDGLIKWAPHNLLPYSEDFSNAAWTKSDVSIDSNVIVAPDGTATADKVIEDGTNATHYIAQTISYVAGQTYTHAIWAQPNERNVIQFIFTSGSFGALYANFSLVGSGSTVQSSGVSATITKVGDWYLCTATATAATTSSGGLALALQDSSSAARAASYTGDGTSGLYIWGAHVYRSDLGGMAPVPGAATGFETYVPTNGSAEYLPRVGHHVYDTTTSAWVNEGLLLESEARTNLLLSTATLSTQSATVTAVPHTLSFTGTGTVTLSGVSTDGPLVGTGTGENNRVNLTFTPTAGTLTLTVSGTVSNAQLEVGSTPSSYMPSNATTQGSRAAQTLDVPPAEFGWNSSGMSFAMEGRMTYTDNGTGANISGGDHQFFSISQSLTNYILHGISTSGSRTGQPIAEQRSSAQNGVSGVRISSLGGGQDFAPGVLVPYNVSARHSTAGVQGANEGTANSFTATPTDKVTLADLSNESLEFGVKYMGTIRQFRQWNEDIGETGIEEASS